VFHDLARIFHPLPVSFPMPLPPRLLKRLLSGPGSFSAPWGDAPACHTFSGTAAIHQAIRVLSLLPGDRVLCPSYNCGHEIEPLLRAGLEVDYFTVGADLNVDLDDLEARISKRTKAVLVTHYFGFPQPLTELRQLCDARGLYLLEDCAHGLFSREKEKFLGATGDVAIFSMRKTIPLPNGGALIANRPDLRLPEALPSPPLLSTWSKTAELVKKWLLLRFSSRSQRPLRLLAAPFTLLPPSIHLLQRLGLLGPLASFDPDDEEFEFDGAVLDWKMAELGERIARNVKGWEIVQQRRANFAILLEGLRSIPAGKPLFTSLPPGVCPLCFPLFVYNREVFIQKLQGRAITAAKWWETFHGAVPWQKYPDSILLKDHVVVLPVHQYLNEQHMQRIVDALHEPGRMAPARRFAVELSRFES
jgi:perosamine synthetase